MWLWLGVRACFGMLLVFYGFPPIPTNFALALAIVGITGAALLADLQRRRERVLLGNLGVRLVIPVYISTFTALLFEVILIVRKWGRS